MRLADGVDVINDLVDQRIHLSAAAIHRSLHVAHLASENDNFILQLIERQLDLGVAIFLIAARCGGSGHRQHRQQ